MLQLLKQTFIIFIALTIVTGIAYPAAVTLLSQFAFPHQANGSLLERNGKIVGSELIGQQFDDPRYFWPRPSATSPAYNGGASTGSNLGPTNPAQHDDVRTRVEALRQAHPDESGPVPIDLVTASGSGLDPHITPAAAAYQVHRVAMARAKDPNRVRELVKQHTAARTFGILGEPRVNILQLNLALDDLH